MMSTHLKILLLLRSPIDSGTNPRNLEENYVSYNGKIQNMKIFFCDKIMKPLNIDTHAYKYADTHVCILDSVI